MPRGKKTVNDGKYTSPQEVAKMVEEGALWMYQNPEMRFTDFIDHFKEKWNLQTRMVAHHRKAALAKMNEIIDDNILAKKKMASVSLLNRLRKLNDPKLELEYLKELNKVGGLYVNQVDVTSNGEKVDFDLKSLVSFDKPEEDGKTED